MSKHTGLSSTYHNNSAKFLLSLTIIALSGCTTMMGGGKATENSKGLRYYLPAPHIILTPKSDGTVTVEVKYVPDPNNAYTLNLKSYFSNSTFDITTNNGMLTSINLNSDTSAVPSSAITAIETLKKEDLKTKDAENKTKQQKADTRSTAINTLANTIREKKEKIELLEDEERFYQNNPNHSKSEELTKVRFDLSQEKLKLKQLEGRLTVADSGSDSFNSPTEPNEPSLQKSYGPVLFRVLPIEGGVKLVSLESQRLFQTSTSALPGGIAVADQPIKFSPDTAIVKAGSENLDIIFTSSKEITIDREQTNLTSPSEGVTKIIIPGSKLPISVGGTNSKSIKLVLPEDLPSGIYQLNLVFRVDGGQRQQEPLTIHWLTE
jgi:hypothetical protein